MINIILTGLAIVVVTVAAIRINLSILCYKEWGYFHTCVNCGKWAKCKRKALLDRGEICENCGHTSWYPPFAGRWKFGDQKWYNPGTWFNTVVEMRDSD